MTEYMINGIFPRTEGLIKLTRDMDRNRASEEQVFDAQENERKTLFELQNTAQYYTDGLLNWQDLNRPFVDIVDNCRAGSLVRFFQTNSFYRTIHFTGSPDLLENNLENWYNKYFFHDKKLNKRLYVFPSPSLFMRFSSGIEMSDIIEILYRAAEFVDSISPGAFVFAEPFLDDEPIKNPELLGDFFSRLRMNLKSKIFIHTYFGNITQRLLFYHSLPVHGLGVDMYRTSIQDLSGNSWPKDMGFIAEIIDTENTLLEDINYLDDFIVKLQELVNPAFVIVSGNADFQFLPYDFAVKKIEILKNLRS